MFKDDAQNKSKLDLDEDYEVKQENKVSAMESQIKDNAYSSGSSINSEKNKVYSTKDKQVVLNMDDKGVKVKVEI